MKGILGLKTQSQKEVTIEGFPMKKVIAVTRSRGEIIA